MSNSNDLTKERLYQRVWRVDQAILDLWHFLRKVSRINNWNNICESHSQSKTRFPLILMLAAWVKISILPDGGGFLTGGLSHNPFRRRRRETSHCKPLDYDSSFTLHFRPPYWASHNTVTNYSKKSPAWFRKPMRSPRCPRILSNPAFTPAVTSFKWYYPTGTRQDWDQESIREASRPEATLLGFADILSFWYFYEQAIHPKSGSHVVV